MKRQNGSKIKQQRVRLLAKSKALLNENGNRLTLIMGILFCIMATVSVSIMVASLYEALAISRVLGDAMATVVFGVAQWVLWFFMVFPLYLGVLRVAGQLCRGERVEIATFFAFYRSLSSLWRAWRIELRVLWGAFPILAVLASGYAPLFCETTELYNAVMIAISSVSPLLLIWGFFDTSRIFAFAIFAVGDDSMPLRRVAKQAKNAVRKKLSSVLAMRLRMIVGFVLSLLSIGVITLIHTLPLTLLVYSELANELSETDEV